METNKTMMLFKPGTIYFNKILNKLNLVLKIEPSSDQDYSTVFMLMHTGMITKISVPNTCLRGQQQADNWQIV